MSATALAVPPDGGAPNKEPMADTRATPAPGPRRSGRRLPGRLARAATSAPVVGTVAVVLALEALARGSLIPNDAIPPPLHVVEELSSEVRKSIFWSQLGRTLQAWSLGLLIATCAAVPLGILAGMSVRVYHSVRVMVDILRPIPAIALLPLMLLVLGINMRLEVFTVALAAFWPLFFQTVYGMHDIDPTARDTARAYRIGKLNQFVFVSLPGASPYIATGMRISATVALLGAVGTELVVGLPGLGSTVASSSLGGNIDLMYAYIAATGIVGLVIAGVFHAVERRLLRWHPSQHKGRER